MRWLIEKVYTQQNIGTTTDCFVFVDVYDLKPINSAGVTTSWFLISVLTKCIDKKNSNTHSVFELNDQCDCVRSIWHGASWLPVSNDQWANEQRAVVSDSPVWVNVVK